MPGVSLTNSLGKPQPAVSAAVAIFDQCPLQTVLKMLSGEDGYVQKYWGPQKLCAFLLVSLFNHEKGCLQTPKQQSFRRCSQSCSLHVIQHCQQRLGSFCQGALLQRFRLVLNAGLEVSSAATHTGLLAFQKKKIHASGRATASTAA